MESHELGVRSGSGDIGLSPRGLWESERIWGSLRYRPSCLQLYVGLSSAGQSPEVRDGSGSDGLTPTLPPPRPQAPPDFSLVYTLQSEEWFSDNNLTTSRSCLTLAETFRWLIFRDVFLMWPLQPCSLSLPISAPAALGSHGPSHVGVIAHTRGTCLPALMICLASTHWPFRFQFRCPLLQEAFPDLQD